MQVENRAVQVENRAMQVENQATNRRQEDRQEGAFYQFWGTTPPSSLDAALITPVHAAEPSATLALAATALALAAATVAVAAAAFALAAAALA